MRWAGRRGWAYTDRNNFAPRIGLAYKLTSDNKTVVRSAYGIFYDGLTVSTWASVGGGPYTGTENAPPNKHHGRGAALATACDVPFHSLAGRLLPA